MTAAVMEFNIYPAVKTLYGIIGQYLHIASNRESLMLDYAIRVACVMHILNIESVRHRNNNLSLTVYDIIEPHVIPNSITMQHIQVSKRRDVRDYAHVSNLTRTILIELIEQWYCTYFDEVCINYANQLTDKLGTTLYRHADWDIKHLLLTSAGMTIAFAVSDYRVVEYMRLVKDGVIEDKYYSEHKPDELSPSELVALGATLSSLSVKCNVNVLGFVDVADSAVVYQQYLSKPNNDSPFITMEEHQAFMEANNAIRHAKTATNAFDI